MKEKEIVSEIYLTQCLYIRFQIIYNNLIDGRINLSLKTSDRVNEKKKRRTIKPIMSEINSNMQALVTESNTHALN